MKIFYPCIIILCIFAGETKAQTTATSGNPVIKGWYADPEAAIFKKQYWIYPTFSDKYNKQVFFDAFSSTDLIKWTKHAHIFDTAAISDRLVQLRVHKMGLKPENMALI